MLYLICLSSFFAVASNKCNDMTAKFVCQLSLGELPEHVEECKQWLSDHQMKDGGMSRSIYGPSDTTDEGFITIQALHMLERKLNPYWVRIVT